MKTLSPTCLHGIYQYKQQTSWISIFVRVSIWYFYEKTKQLKKLN